MYHRRMGRGRRLRLGIFSAIGILAAVLCAAAVFQGFTKGTPVTVEDWDKAYTFTMGGHIGRKDDRALAKALAKAQEQGMPPLGSMDEAVFQEDSPNVTVRRGVELFVQDRDQQESYVAYKGDTIEQALLANEIQLKETDQVAPSRGMVVSAPLTVEIKRLCRVNITVDGETLQVKMTEGTVAEALSQAGVTLGEDDTCSHELDEPIKDDMHLEIGRVMNISLTAGGRTRAYKVSALTVAEALEKCGFALGKEDRLNVPAEAPITAGMRIVLKRVETREETETEEIPYETKYITTRDLPEGETNLLTPGMKGKREKKFSAVYVDGKLESREMIEEKVVAEPVKEIIMRGSGYHTVAPKLEFEDGGGNKSTPAPSSPASGISVNTAAGTLVDDQGKTVSYSKAITGECTAYCIPGGTTSVGLVAKRGVIAVDPDIIPYGTKMFVASPDGSIVYGYGVAGDTGGACLDGDIIADLCYDTLEECSIIGRRDMVLYILD